MLHAINFGESAFPKESLNLMGPSDDLALTE
jgi:hypothetical protein